MSDVGNGLRSNFAYAWISVVCMLRAFSGFGAISRWAMGVFRILKWPNHLEMVGPFQDPENAQGHGMHLPPKAVKP